MRRKKARALEEMGYPAEEARNMAAAHDGPMTLDFLTRAEKLLKETPAVIAKPPGFSDRHGMKVRIGWVLSYRGNVCATCGDDGWGSNTDRNVCVTSGDDGWGSDTDGTSVLLAGMAAGATAQTEMSVSRPGMMAGVPTQTERLCYLRG